MSLIPKIAIPIVADYSRLAAGLAGAARAVHSFVEKAAPPIALTVNLVPLGHQVEKAKHMIDEIGEHATVSLIASKIAPSLSHAATPAMLAKMAIDSQINRGADLVIRVNQGALRTGLNAAKATVSAGMRLLGKVAVLPLTITSIAFKVGMALAQAYAFQQIKKMTGMSTIKLGLIYVGVRVGLAVATRILKAGVATMARVATIPFRVALGAFRMGLRTAANLAKATARQIGGILAIPMRVGGAALGLGLAGTALGGLVGVPAAIGAAVMAASNLNETVSKVGFTFGDSAKIVIAGADEMAAKYGVVKRSFLDGAASIGLIGRAAGQTDAKSAEMGAMFAKLASDVSSFINIPFSEAIEKMRSGLVGEAEPLRSIGVLLNEDAVKAQALAMGFHAVHGRLDEGAKVMARAALIQKGLATASGDLARTGGELANRLREIQGRVVNLGAQLGGYLLPAAKALSTAFADLAGSLSGRLAANTATFEAWGEKLRVAAEWAGVMLRHLDRVKAIGGILWTNLGTNMQAAIEPVLKYMADWTVYLGKLLSRSIEDGIEAALTKSTPKWVKFAAMAFQYGTPVGWIAKAADMAGGGPARAPLEMPKFQRPQFAGGPEIARQVEVKASEGLRLVAERAKAMVPALMGVAGVFLATKQKVADARKAQMDAMNRQTAFVARAQNWRRDAAAPLPRGFSAKFADMPAMRGKEKADRVFTAPAPTRKANVAPGEAMAALGALQARAFGGIAGLGMPAFAAAALMGNRMGQLQPQVTSKRMAGLAEAGSKEAYSSIARFLGYGGKDKSLEVQGRQLVQLERIANNTAKTNKTAAPGVFDLPK